MNIPEDVKKWLAGLDKKQVNEFILYVIARFTESFINKKLRGR